MPWRPSDILQRRPDVASAERAMAAANAQIGVATAAFTRASPSARRWAPRRVARPLFDAPSLRVVARRVPAQPLIDAGRIRANVDFAHGGYDVTVANYRRVVLTAMQEAEDGITGLAALESAPPGAGRDRSPRRVLDLANTRYEGGVASPWK